MRGADPALLALLTALAACTPGIATDTTSSASSGTGGSLPSGCSDHELDGDESGVDCGGSCSPCETGGGCVKRSDCASRVCQAGMCAEPSCLDGIENGSEIDVDCGPSCIAEGHLCGFGAPCGGGEDCSSGVCSASICVPSSRTQWVDKGELPAGDWRDGAMVYDSARAHMVFVDHGMTLTWDGSSWSSLTVTGATARTLHSAAFDSLRQMVVVFGGTTGSNELRNLEEWDGVGATWVPVNPNPQPSPRFANAMAFDSNAMRTVNFGGSHVSAAPSNSIYEWIGGTAWLGPYDPVPQPTGRGGSAMVFDSIRHRMVIYGGNDGAMDLAQTWEWDGAAWASIPDGAPGPRARAAMAFDPDRGKAVLFGRIPGDNNETWEYDGAHWAKPEVLGLSPAGDYGGAMAYDPIRKRAVYVRVGDTPAHVWEYYALATACTADTDCGSLHCSDHLCCDTACTDPCFACNTVAAPGLCQTVANTDDKECSGTCDTSGACAAD